MLFSIYFGPIIGLSLIYLLRNEEISCVCIAYIGKNIVLSFFMTLQYWLSDETKVGMYKQKYVGMYIQT